MRRLSPTSVVLASLIAAVSMAAARPPRAEQILRKAEDVRNPDLDYAVEFSIHGVSRGPTPAERDASYSMIARGKDRTVILMRAPEFLYGAVVLMVENRYWMLLPKASKAWELSGAQMMNGDVATGDLARANLTRGYSVELAGEDVVDGEACWRLELQQTDDAMHYARIVYWVAKKGFLPKKLEHYGRTGTLQKTLRYGDYQKGALGLRSMRLDIESLNEWKEASTLVFSNLRRISPPPASFTSEGLLAFRDAALAARVTPGSGEATLERILHLVDSPKGLE